MQLTAAAEDLQRVALHHNCDLFDMCLHSVTLGSTLQSWTRHPTDSRNVKSDQLSPSLYDSSSVCS